MSTSQSAIFAHFCRLISGSVGAKFRRFLKYIVFFNDSLSLSNLCAASRVVTDRVLLLSGLPVGIGQSLDLVAPFLSMKRAWDWSTVATCFPHGPEIAVRVAVTSVAS